jgi:hypothetical protein
MLANSVEALSGRVWAHPLPKAVRGNWQTGAGRQGKVRLNSLGEGEMTKSGILSSGIAMKTKIAINFDQLLNKLNS